MLALCGVFTTSSSVYSLWCGRAWLYKLWLHNLPLHFTMALPLHWQRAFSSQPLAFMKQILLAPLPPYEFCWHLWMGSDLKVRQRQTESYTLTVWLHKCTFFWKLDRRGNSFKVHFPSLCIFTLWLFESMVSNLNKLHQQSCLHCAVLLVGALCKTTI